MTVDREKFLSDVLDSIEQREARLLTWGIVDGFFDHHELLSLIDQKLEEALEAGLEDFLSADAVLAEMSERSWVTAVELSDGTTGYRSRMAETVRLLQRLRQLFPKHAGAAGWQQAPTLVADFRFLRRRRQYPKRNIPSAEAYQRIREVSSSSALVKAVTALVNPGGSPIMLAGFQVRAAQRILRGIENDQALATIVCAGTGSGKTLSFYLPALASIARHLIADPNGKPWVKAVALYPRTELLKDQLREVLGRVIALKRDMPKGAVPAIRVGALFGDTPMSAQYCKWPSVGQDLVCPTLACLHCNGELRWKHEDRVADRERLVCAHCGFELDDTLFPLTRNALKARPPDILFTTTEMLNQRMADNGTAHLFGVGTKAVRGPELVLLDEVHTYEGRHGAQVAYLMRRWQRQVDQPLRFVGLSATLREAREFFASLTGCRHSLVDEVSPQSDEIEAEGAEYMIALRGDPVSRTALLSTTIQTTMLLQRCLDPHAARVQESKSRGMFGQKTFVFTDNLDVINRLYFDLLSAEGRNSFGQPDTRNAPDGGLALLRAPGTSHFRYANGQDWRFCESLQGNLQHRLEIKRVSSQDRGVDPSAEVIVATAVLEVGFDDPAVGAVVQHKAPRGMANFLQRKGRAGRTRGMRPWTVVVLSDYGRDRAAYQSYDLLFDPELPVRTLPMANRYLTRMQAVYATIDFLGARLQDAPFGSVWTDLSGPVSNAQRRSRLERELLSVLESDHAMKRLADHLQWTLRLPAEEISAILWEFPRPLMTAVLPTALRRIATGWSAGGEEGADYTVDNNPLPDFIPATLFADLNLAEVDIKLPDDGRARGLERNVMSVFGALREFAPGRVSRRYGVRTRTERHWIPPSAEVQAGDVAAPAQSDLDILAMGRHVALGQFLMLQDEEVVAIPVYRPVELAPVAPPKTVKDSSNGSLKWRSQIVASVDPTWLLPPDRGIWSELVARVGFFTHARHAPVEVRRFATGATAEVGVGTEKVRVETQFAMDGAPVAMGANYFADAVLFQLRIPDSLFGRVGEGADKKWRALRTMRFIDDAWRGRALSMVTSPFMREWLAQIFLSAVTFEAIERGSSIEASAAALAEGRASITLTNVLHLLFQSQVVEDPSDGNHDMPQEKLRQELEECLHRDDVVSELFRSARVLWAEATDEWEPWLRSVFHCTLAAALLRAVTDLCPTIDPDDLTVDLTRGAVDPGLAAGFDASLAEVWFTEKNPGGSGLVEEVMRRYSEDPRRFFSVVGANLEMSEFELIDHQLDRLVHLLTSDPDSEVTQCVDRFRNARSQEDMAADLRELRRALLEAGFSPFHGFFVSMGNRVLRQGSGVNTDAYIATVLNRWATEENRLGVEIDLRVMSYFLSQSDDIDHAVSEFSQAVGADRGAWRMSAIYGLLWARGRTIRQTALQVRNPFGELPPVERLLVAESLVDDRMRIAVTDDDWLERTAEHLAAGRLVTLTCRESERERLGVALNSLVTNPIDSGYFRAYARLQGIRQSTTVLEADIELIEAVQ